MRRATETTILATVVLLALGPVGQLWAQAPKPQNQSATAAPAPVCPLLSAAEVRKLTGQAGYRDEPWEVGPGEGIGGGSACVYQAPATTPYGEGPPMIGFTLISGKDWTQRRRTVKQLPGCKREPVKGLGDDAYFESCPGKGPKKRTDDLYVQVGSNDLILQMDVKPPATEASSRPTVVAVVRALAARLR